MSRDQLLLAEQHSTADEELYALKPINSNRQYAVWAPALVHSSFFRSQCSCGNGEPVLSFCFGCSTSMCDVGCAHQHRAQCRGPLIKSRRYLKKSTFLVEDLRRIPDVISYDLLQGVQSYRSNQKQNIWILPKTIREEFGDDGKSCGIAQGVDVAPLQHSPVGGAGSIFSHECAGCRAKINPEFRWCSLGCRVLPAQMRELVHAAQCHSTMKWSGVAAEPCTPMVSPGAFGSPFLPGESDSADNSSPSPTPKALKRRKMYGPLRSPES